MHTLLIVLVGLFAGTIANMVMSGRRPGSVVIPMLLGVAGAALASFIARSMGLYHGGEAGPAVLASFLGAIVLLALYRLISPRKMAQPERAHPTSL